MLTIIDTLNAILPSFILIGAGWIVHRFRIVSDQFLDEASRLVFYIALPALIFLKLYEIESSTVFPIYTIAVCVFGAVLSYLTTGMIASRLKLDNPSFGAFFQGASRTNFAVLGLYLANNLYGAKGVLSATLLMVATIPVNNFISVLVLYRYSPSRNFSPVSAIKTLISNPMILSLLVVPVIWIKPPIPQPILQAAHDASSIALPLALIAIGTSLRAAQNLRQHIPVGSLSVVQKLVGMPIIVIGIAVLAGIRGYDLAAIALFSATPTATASFILAKQFRSNTELTSWIIAASTLVSIVTLPATIIGLKLFQLVP